MQEQNIVQIPPEQADNVGLPYKMSAHEAVERGFSIVAAIEIST